MQDEDSFTEIGLGLLCAAAKSPYNINYEAGSWNESQQNGHHPVRNGYRFFHFRTVNFLRGLLVMIPVAILAVRILIIILRCILFVWVSAICILLVCVLTIRVLLVCVLTLRILRV